MSFNNNSFNGVFAVVIASFLWGTTGTAASFVPNVSPLATGAFAMGFGGLLLLLHARKRVLQERTKLLSKPVTLLVGGLSVAVYPLAFYSSMKLSGIAIGTVVSIASAPFFTIVFERLISKKLISKKWMVSFAFGAFGVVLLVFNKQDNVELNDSFDFHYLGIVLGLVAGITYATYSWCAREMIEVGISSNSSMASLFGIASVILLPTLILTGDNLLTGTINIAVAFYMAIIPMFLGYLCFGYGLRDIEASTATLITLLEPAVATLFAIVIVGEKFQLLGWIGMGSIGICLVLQVLRLPKSEPTTASSCL